MISFNFEQSIEKVCANIDNFFYFNNGEKKDINRQVEQFDVISKNICKILRNSRTMPAFGVSLNSDTLDALKENEWLQINFNRTQEVNGLIFDALLFKLEVSGGINLIRCYNNRYEGRCIYLDFDSIVDLRSILN